MNSRAVYFSRLATALDRGDAPDVTAEDGLAVQAFIEAAYRSSESGLASAPPPSSRRRWLDSSGSHGTAASSSSARLAPGAVAYVDRDWLPAVFPAVPSLIVSADGTLAWCEGSPAETPDAPRP